MFSKNSLHFFNMSKSFFDDFSGFHEFMQKDDRGHGIMIIDINDLLLAIPMRSKLYPHMASKRHIFPYKTYFADNGKEYLLGLDFSKTMVIENEHIDIGRPFAFRDPAEKQFYIDSFPRIRNKILNYIKTYIQLCKRISNQEQPHPAILKLFKYSTLPNFHKALGIELTQEKFLKTLELSPYPKAKEMKSLR